MISVMIVDDMPIFREYLREAIDWHAYGFEICCEAKNGKEALELVKEYEPDIVLSDITMPFMDGLEFSERLKEVSETTEVVLITGNSEFEYAKKAVKLGVADYIVKPFEKEELIVTLLNLKDNIEKAIEMEIDREDKAHQQNDPLFKQLIYSDRRSDLRNAFNQLKLPIKKESYFYITIIETEATMNSHATSEQAMSWKSVIGSLYKDYVQIEGMQYQFKDYEDRIVFLNVLEKEMDFFVEQEELEVLIGMIKEKLSFDVTIGIGTLYSELDGIRKSYLESLNALNSRFIDDRNRVIFYRQNAQVEKGYGFYSAEVNEVIINYLNQLNREETIHVLNSIFKEADELEYNSEYKRMICMGLMSLLLSYVVKVGKNINDIFEGEFKPYSFIQEDSFGKQRSYILGLYDTVIGYLNKHKNSQSSVIASQAKACIDEHYSDPEFNMNTLTQKLLVNQTYLRKMFKSEYHTTISEYLVKVRMDHAKQLVLDSYYKLSVIAELVGYKDAGYFSKSFKKYFGVSPSDYNEI